MWSIFIRAMVELWWAVAEECALVKQLTIRDVPIAVYFWRRNRKVRWAKYGERHISSLGQHGAIELSDEQLQEIILTDYQFCDNCWEQLTFPPDEECHACGEVQEPYERKKQRLIAWAGSSDIHW